VAVYNEDGFTSVDYSSSPNLNGFIASVDEEERCQEIFHRRIAQEYGICNHTLWGPVFGRWGGHDLAIARNCHQNENSRSKLGGCYGRSPGINPSVLFGQEIFRISKI
jgi:hypothetical protein